MGLHAATAAFGQFGDIARVEVLPSDMPMATVSFFDVRSVVRAREMLGDNWCWPGEQCGERSVWLPGTMELGQEDLIGVSSIRQDPAGNGYVVEFFDVRDASRVTAACLRNARTAKVKKTPAEPTSSEPPCSAADNEAGERSVLLQGLPNAMCAPACFEVMLEQAGLVGDVLSHNIRQGRSCGEATLKVASEGAASRCIKHFHGRVWDPSGTPVSATRLAPPPGLPSAMKAGVLAPPPGLEGLCATKDADSEESTDAGASEAGEYHDESTVDGCSIVVA
jgi:hypothetical protein